MMTTKLRIQGFFGRWLRICYQFAQIQDGGSNMATKNIENFSISMKVSMQGFLGSLITNPLSVFTNPTWRIQYGGQTFKKLFNYYTSVYVIW